MGFGWKVRPNGEQIFLKQTCGGHNLYHFLLIDIV
jgi:hypothetical protein